MCGIIGHNLPIEDSKQFCDLTGHRGPDLTASEKFGDFTLGHNRLSIIDLSSRSNQPFLSDDGNFVIVYNGEVYNYLEIKKSLKGKYNFRTDSDTEVVLYNYIDKGPACLNDFIGMFSFSIYDIRNKKLFCARDRLGIKPFHYYHKDGEFVFSSEIKVIKELINDKLQIDRSVFPLYFHYQRVPYDRSIYQGVNKLLPGHYLTYQNDKLVVEKYWDVKQSLGTNYGLSESEIISNLDDLLDDAIKLRMISDVQLGTFLSGGLDSSLILYYMAKNSDTPINTFTVGFDIKTKYDERSSANIVANHFNSNHRELIISPNITELIPNIVHHFDEPYGNSMALLTYELTKEAKKHATVALAGDGGDEVFGGYPRYEALGLYKKLKPIPKVFWKSFGKIFNVLPESTSGNHALRRMRIFASSLSKPEGEMYNDWVSYFSKKEIDELLKGKQDFDLIVAEYYNTIDSADLLYKASLTDLKTFLVANLLDCGDRMSMANSFETRVPLIDHRLIEFMNSIESRWRIKNGQTKYLLRSILKGKVPQSILEKPKWGFTSPMGQWLNKDLKSIIDNYLNPDDLDRNGILNGQFVRKIIKEQKSGRRDRSSYLWSLIIFVEWCRQNGMHD